MKGIIHHTTGTQVKLFDVTKVVTEHPILESHYPTFMNQGVGNGASLILVATYFDENGVLLICTNTTHISTIAVHPEALVPNAPHYFTPIQD